MTKFNFLFAIILFTCFFLYKNKATCKILDLFKEFYPTVSKEHHNNFQKPYDTNSQNIFFYAN